MTHYKKYIGAQMLSDSGCTPLNTHPQHFSQLFLNFSAFFSILKFKKFTARDLLNSYKPYIARYNHVFSFDSSETITYSPYMINTEWTCPIETYIIDRLSKNTNKKIPLTDITIARAMGCTTETARIVRSKFFKKISHKVEQKIHYNRNNKLIVNYYYDCDISQYVKFEQVTILPKFILSDKNLKNMEYGTRVAISALYFNACIQEICGHNKIIYGNSSAQPCTTNLSDILYWMNPRQRSRALKIYADTFQLKKIQHSYTAELDVPLFNKDFRSFVHDFIMRSQKRRVIFNLEHLNTILPWHDDCIVTRTDTLAKVAFLKAIKKNKQKKKFYEEKNKAINKKYLYGLEGRIYRYANHDYTDRITKRTSGHEWVISDRRDIVKTFHRFKGSEEQVFAKFLEKYLDHFDNNRICKKINYRGLLKLFRVEKFFKFIMFWKPIKTEHIEKNYSIEKIDSPKKTETHSQIKKATNEQIANAFSKYIVSC